MNFIWTDCSVFASKQDSSMSVTKKTEGKKQQLQNNWSSVSASNQTAAYTADIIIYYLFILCFTDDSWQLELCIFSEGKKGHTGF